MGRSGRHWGRGAGGQSAGLFPVAGFRETLLGEVRALACSALFSLCSSESWSNHGLDLLIVHVCVPPTPHVPKEILQFSVLSYYSHGLNVSL